MAFSPKYAFLPPLSLALRFALPFRLLLCAHTPQKVHRQQQQRLRLISYTPVPFEYTHTQAVSVNELRVANCLQSASSNNNKHNNSLCFGHFYLHIHWTPSSASLAPSISFSRSLSLSRSTSLNTPINCLVIAQCCAVAVAVCCCCCCAWPKVQVEVCSKKKLSLSRRRRQRSLLIQAERVASVDWALDPTMNFMLSLLSLLSSTLTLFVVCIGFSAAALQIYRLLSLIASLGPEKTTAITTTTCDTHASLIYEACARTLAHCQMVEGEGKREKERNALSSPQLTQRRSSDRDRGTAHTGCPFCLL